MSFLRRRTRNAVAVMVAMMCVAFHVPSASALGILPPRDPLANIAPVPNFLSTGSCTSGADATWTCENPCAVTTPTIALPAFTNTPACSSYVLLALNRARSSEGLRPIILPTNWNKLSVPQQLFVIIDLERTTRGLPPYLGLNRALTLEAQHAAQSQSDPRVAAGFAVGRNPQHRTAAGGAWAGDYSVLGADYNWMYADGWGGATSPTYNAACTSAHAAGCWAHRDELLGYAPRFNPGVGLRCTTCEMGTGFAVLPRYGSFTALVELPAAAPPAMTFTWAKNVLPFLPSTPSPSTTTTSTTGTP